MKQARKLIPIDGWLRNLQVGFALAICGAVSSTSLTSTCLNTLATARSVISNALVIVLTSIDQLKGGGHTAKPLVPLNLGLLIVLSWIKLILANIAEFRNYALWHMFSVMPAALATPSTLPFWMHLLLLLSSCLNYAGLVFKAWRYLPWSVAV